MAHYAKVVDGIVDKVIVAEANFFDTFIDTSPGGWIQTSYNTYGGVHSLGGTPLRMNFAAVGGTYDLDKDVFIGPQPYPSWILNETNYQWEAPTAIPDDGKIYGWDEETTNWMEIE